MDSLSAPWGLSFLECTFLAVLHADYRLAARPAHIDLGNQLRDQGEHLYGAALIDENDRMIGSVLIVDFNSREALDEMRIRIRHM